MTRMSATPRTRRRRLLEALAAGLLLLLGPARAAPESITVFAGVEPVGWLARAVGGERVSVRVLVPPGQSPHSFEPTPRQLAAMERAGLYVAVGMPFEAAWVPRLQDALPDLRLVELLPAGAGHDHGRADPHPWTDPLDATGLAARIRDALVEIDPGGRAQYESGFRELAEALEVAHDAMAGALAPVRGRAFLVYHPAWGALAARYGLRQLAVEADGKAPGARSLANLITRAREEGVCALFVQPQFSTRAATQVARALEAELVTLDPLAGDLARGLPEVARTLARYMESPCPR